MNALHNFSESMQGILNAIIYGMNTDVKRQWKNFYKKYIENIFKTPETNLASQTTEPEPDVDSMGDDKSDYNYHTIGNSFRSDFELEERSNVRKVKKDSQWEMDMHLRLVQKENYISWAIITENYLLIWE